MSIQRLTNWGGDHDHRSTDSAITDGNFYGFTVLEDDTVVSVMSGGPDGEIPSPAIDFRDVDHCNISGKNLVKGATYTVELNYIIKNFHCSAGSVLLHRAASK